VSRIARNVQSAFWNGLPKSGEPLFYIINENLTESEAFALEIRS